MKYTDELDKVSYSLGLSIASNLISSGVTTINAEAFIDGLNVVFSGKMPEIMPDEANNILQDYFDKLQQAKGKEAKAEGEKFLAENKKKEGVVALPSGLQYKILTAGNGPKPKASAGWVEALQLMPVGSKWQLYIPSELAYGTHGAGQSIGPNQTLIFDVELLAII